MGRSSIAVNVYWLYFQAEAGKDRGKFIEYSIKWSGTYCDNKGVIHDHIGHAADINDLFSELILHFAEELKNPNLKCHIEIVSDRQGIIIEATSVAKKYFVRKELSFEEICELGKLLNTLNQVIEDQQDP